MDITRGTVRSVIYVREDITDHGKFMVYNYELNEYTGIMQARHVNSFHPIGSSVVFELRFLNRDKNIAVGSMYSAYKEEEINNRRSLEKEIVNIDAERGLTTDQRIEILKAAVNTPGVKNKIDIMNTAESYIDWLDEEY